MSVTAARQDTTEANTQARGRGPLPGAVPLRRASHSKGSEGMRPPVGSPSPPPVYLLVGGFPQCLKTLPSWYRVVSGVVLLHHLAHLGIKWATPSSLTGVIS